LEIAMIRATGKLVEQAKIVTGLPPRTPSTSTPDYVSMKGYSRCTVLIFVDNGATVTGSAITLKQATAVAGTSEKALSFSKAYKNEDVDNTDALTEFDVTSNTFTTLTTNNLNLAYAIEVTEDMLDVAGDFDCIRAGTGDGANMALCVAYILWPAKFAKATPPAAITD
jgi:hypothetical protein